MRWIKEIENARVWCIWGDMRGVVSDGRLSTDRNQCLCAMGLCRTEVSEDAAHSEPFLRWRVGYHSRQWGESPGYPGNPECSAEKYDETPKWSARVLTEWFRFNARTEWLFWVYQITFFCQTARLTRYARLSFRSRPLSSGSRWCEIFWSSSGWALSLVSRRMLDRVIFSLMCSFVLSVPI